MSILQDLFTHEVKPARGCTEPIAVALACSHAKQAVGGQLDKISVEVSPEIFKNGKCVCIPNTDGLKGNSIAAALGALCGHPADGLEVLRNVNSNSLHQAVELVRQEKVIVSSTDNCQGLFINAVVETDTGIGRCQIQGSHTNVILVEANQQVLQRANDSVQQPLAYKYALKEVAINQLIEIAHSITSEEYGYILQGVEMNLAVSEQGRAITGGVGNNLLKLQHQGLIKEDIISSTEILTASATDARMAGVNMSVMSSGGSGNQGIVAILVPYNVGIKMGVEFQIILQSIAFSHLLNSYVKCFLGPLAPICGCAVAAGIGATAAVAYQQTNGGQNKRIIAMAINNLVADIAGLICDGAKGSCALKVVTSTNASIKAAFLALGGFTVESGEGIVGNTPEQTIHNLGKISKNGMSGIDKAVLSIMKEGK